MRIVHTSDWHAGRVWKGQNRLPELAEVLDHLATFIERERIDLVLMAGDVFDTSSPSAEAELVVSAFFKRIGRAQVPSVVIAGNHDSAPRLEAWGVLADLVGVRARGLPQSRANGGVIEVPVRSGHTAVVAAVPFAPPGRIIEALTLARDETVARQQYAEAIQRMFAHLSTGYRPDTVNLAVAHAHLTGAKPANSERVVTLGEDWAATPQALPATAQYIALGHIHRPQRVEAAAARTEYAGSPMQLDFGEVGEVKSFVVVEVEPGRPPVVTRVPYEGAKSLGQWQGSLAQLEQEAESLRAYGFLKLRVELETPQPDLNRHVRRMLGNVVAVDAVLPTVEAVEDVAAPTSLAPADQFSAFYRQRHQREVSAETLAMFAELHAEAEGQAS